MVERAITGQREVEPQKGLENLHIDEYGAVYDRFLLASIAKTEEEAANFINPDNTTIEFNDLTEDSLKDRNYNLVAEKSSIAERKKQWGVMKFSDAYSQWQTEFTRFMRTEITAGSAREQALRIIMSDTKKKAAEFTEGDADMLFEEFCDGKSDINTFIERVKINLRHQGKINPAKLNDLLDHLGWIASGLFGKNTASKAVTRLIELESAIHNNPKQVIDTFNSNKDRINNLKRDEKETLDLLYPYLIPQVRVSEVAPSVPAPDILKPAPVTEPKKVEDEDEPPPSPPPAEKTPESAEKSLQDMNLEELMKVRDEMLNEFSKEDRDKLYSEALNMTEDEIKKMPSEKRVKTEGDREEMLRMDIANLTQILWLRRLHSAQPQGAAPPWLASQPAERPVETMTHEATEEIEAAARANSGSLPGQAEFDFDNIFTGTDGDYLNALALVESKYTKLGA